MIALRRNNGQQITPPLLSNAHRVTEDSARRSIEPQSKSGTCVEKASNVDWVMLVIWGFVVFSFAALFLAGYAIWVKCHGDWPPY